MLSRLAYPTHPFVLNIAFMLALAFTSFSLGHEAHTLTPASGLGPSEGYFQTFSRLISLWPMPNQEELIAHAWSEHQYLHAAPDSPTEKELKIKRQDLLDRLEDQLPSIRVTWDGSELKLTTPSIPVRLCRSVESPLLVTVRNVTDSPVVLNVAPQSRHATKRSTSQKSLVAAGSRMPFLCSVLVPTRDPSPQIQLVAYCGDEPIGKRCFVSVPIQLSEPATIRGSIHGKHGLAPGRVTVRCSDGVCRYGGKFANKSTFTDKPIIYPPMGGIRKTQFFYTQGEFELDVPPGATEVILERGFQYQRILAKIDASPKALNSVSLSTDLLDDWTEPGWVSGDTHVHWVTNQWNVDEPLELLAMAQRAEGLRVANNLTLLQRYANQAFIKPSQAPMGPIQEHCDEQFHMQMGEEYRNEDLYGHLCFLNIDWLVQPIGTGAVIAGPDALDYPLNCTAIQNCREQGGISIEAHGAGGNKDVPVNVIYNLTDSLDQMEPDTYYQLLDCGFRLPLTNGSDHPARTLGIARAFVKIDGPFTYQEWIDGIRLGRTFTSSGPLISLRVNDSSIGDTITAGPEELVTIHAKFVSRDPIGVAQIVSNGKVIREVETDSQKADLQIKIPAGESRWIVARCSNRSDGRPEWGFGNFNAITGPGVAHTSPVYVEVGGRPRFDERASEFWCQRIRTHIRDVETKGRFANQSQMQEAVLYLQNGLEMFTQLGPSIKSARQRNEPFDASRNRLKAILRRFGMTEHVRDGIARLENAETFRELAEALKPLVAFEVFINPESRVKVGSRVPKLRLHEGRPQRFLIEVENTAGITAGLNLSGIDVSMNPPGPCKWCKIEVVDSPFTSRHFTGAETEFKVIQITPFVSGVRELRVVGDAGQGTQDLGFRASTDVLLDIEPRLRN